MEDALRLQLPLPSEISSKIICQGLKTPYYNLGLGVLKHFTYSDEDDIVLPERDAELTLFDTTHYLFINQSKPFDIFKLGLFTNMKYLTLIHSGVTGDIQVLQKMPQLSSLTIVCSNIYGNISHLSSLSELKNITFNMVNVYGNIESLFPLKKLEALCISSTNIKGLTTNLQHLKNIAIII